MKFGILICYVIKFLLCEYEGPTINLSGLKKWDGKTTIFHIFLTVYCYFATRILKVLTFKYFYLIENSITKRMRRAEPL